MMHGYGEWTENDGSYYHGFWQNDMRHGENGQAYDSKLGKYYYGTWIEDDYQGGNNNESLWATMRRSGLSGSKEGK